ncbi:POT family-domain-containing protein [Scenedesmus sp. NREL 46B-D3]|nr:POT family-domain-containing protein [Scenedesmus sp. NREL 46B-D3]
MAELNAVSLYVELSAAIGEQQARCLQQSVKWAAEQLVGLPEAAFEAGAQQAAEAAARSCQPAHPRLLQGRSYFELKEYQRAAHVLAGLDSPVAVFLRCYALYLAGERRKEEERIEASGPLGSAVTANPHLDQVAAELEAAAAAGLLAGDGYALYLQALLEIERDHKPWARQLLVQSLNACPCHWGAWQAVAGLALPPHWARHFFLASLCLELQHNAEALSRLQVINQAQALYEDLLARDPARLAGMDTYSNILFVKEAFAPLSHLAHRLAGSDKYTPEACCVIGNYHSLKVTGPAGAVHVSVHSRREPQCVEPSSGPAHRLAAAAADVSTACCAVDEWAKLPDPGNVTPSWASRRVRAALHVESLSVGTNGRACCRSQLQHCIRVSGAARLRPCAAGPALPLHLWPPRAPPHPALAAMLCTRALTHPTLQGQHERAVEYFRRALRLSRTYLSAWTLMGHEYVEMKNAPAAIDAYRSAVALNPRDYRAWYGLGQTYELLSMPFYALHYYRRAALLRPSDPRMWCALGHCYESDGLRMPGLAVRCYRRAVAHGDREGIGLAKLAKLHEAQGERATAAHYYALNLARLDAERVQGGDVTEALLFLAEYTKDMGMLAEAEQYCQRLMDVGGPANMRAKAILRELRSSSSSAAAAAAAAQAAGFGRAAGAGGSRGRAVLGARRVLGEASAGAAAAGDGGSSWLSHDAAAGAGAAAAGTPVGGGGRAPAATPLAQRLQFMQAAGAAGAGYASPAAGNTPGNFSIAMDEEDDEDDDDGQLLADMDQVTPAEAGGGWTDHSIFLPQPQMDTPAGAFAGAMAAAGGFGGAAAAAAAPGATPSDADMDTITPSPFSFPSAAGPPRIAPPAAARAAAAAGPGRGAAGPAATGRGLGFTPGVTPEAAAALNGTAADSAAAGNAAWRGNLMQLLGSDFAQQTAAAAGGRFRAQPAPPGNELCERLAFYGLQTNMGLYLKKELGYPADTASQLLQVWKATVYLTPLLGGYLADAVMGRFWVILVFSIIYFVGMLGITMVNLLPQIKPSRDAAPLAGLATTQAVFWVFMYLTALGSGGIKPCVSSFGGDQFRESSARERGWRSSFFNWFYFSINIGDAAADVCLQVASTVVVGVQESKGYGVGFGIPTIAFGVAIAMFVTGAAGNLYVRVPPEGSPFTRIGRVLKGAFTKRHLSLPHDAAQLHDPEPGTEGALPYSMAHTMRMRQVMTATCCCRLTHDAKCLDKAAIKSETGHQVTLTEVEESKALFGILPLFLCICIYQMTYDPIFTLLPYPGDAMDRRMGATQVPASSISFANTFGVLFTVVFYDLLLVPLMNRLRRPISLTCRIGLGFGIQVLALVSAALIEMARYRVVRQSGLVDRFLDAGPEADPLDPLFTQPMSIWWQAIPYFLLGVSEVFTNIGCMELFYTQVSEGMRSLGASVYLLTVAVGTYLASGLNVMVAAASPHDTWVSNNPLFGHYDWYFWLNAAILVAGLALYIIVARTCGYADTSAAAHRKAQAGDEATKAA